MDITLECPHCKIPFIINEKDLNCCIVRHAVLKSNMQQINPHAPKAECDRLVAENLVLGCAKPVKIIKKKDEYETVICDYI